MPFYDYAFVGITIICICVFGQLLIHYQVYVSLVLSTIAYAFSEPMTIVCTYIMALVYCMSDYVHICGSVD